MAHSVPSPSSGPAPARSSGVLLDWVPTMETELARRAVLDHLLQCVAAIRPAAADESAEAVAARELLATVAAACVDTAPPPALRVLLAEDNPISQKVGLLILRGLGYSPDVAGNGLEVLSALDRIVYDVIFMDVQMPEMDGMEATRRIRAELAADRQPAIIAMTASAEAEDRALCLQAGMDDYLTKPMRADALAAVLEWWGPQTSRVVKERPPTESPRPVAAASAPAGPERIGPAVDTDVFEEFVTNIVGPDAGARNQLIDTYLGDAGARVADLRAAYAAHDTAAVAKAAHGLRSGSALFGAVPLAQLLLELETTARRGTADVRGLVELVQVEFVDVVASLDRLRVGEPTLAG